MLIDRLRWYAFATSRMLRRHWQALALSMLLLLPAMPVLAQTRMLGAPILEVLSRSHGVEWRYAWVHLLEAVGVLWVWAQRTAITGGPFAAFLKSLPVSGHRHRAVDAIVVLVASTPLLLPVVAAAFALAFLPHKAVNYLFVLDLFLITLGWQLSVLSSGAINAIALLVANVFLVGGLEADGVPGIGALGMGLVLAAFALVHTAPVPAGRSTLSGEFTQRRLRSIGVCLRRALSPRTRLQAGIVRARMAATAGRCLMMGSVVTGTWFLLGIWGFDARAIPLTLIAQAAIALIAATLYRDLHAAHFRASHFMQTLPIAAIANARADVLTVAALALPFMFIVPLVLVAHHAMSLESAAALVCSCGPLLAVLYAPQRYAPGQSPLLGTIAAVVWVTVAWQCFV
jgi:hypothetical protein